MGEVNMKVELKGVTAAAAYYTASAHAAAQHRAFVEAVEKMRAEALQLDADSGKQFKDVDAALELLKPIFE
jgi:acetylornithine deacetylase/succinyl-diaminopimelate desuccinylase-like protein